MLLWYSHNKADYPLNKKFLLQFIVICAIIFYKICGRNIL
nr:MAG TPA: hypothetical protein [Caudoviricetes sp.]